MATDGLPPTAPPLAFPSSSLMTMPPSPSSTPSTITPTDTSNEISFPTTLQNPSPLATSVASPENMVADMTTSPSPLFLVLPEMSPLVFPLEYTTAPSPPISSIDLDIPSTSNTPHSPSSFSFVLDIPTGDDTPSPIMSWFPLPSPTFVSWETDTQPSSPTLQPKTLPYPATTSPPFLKNILPSSETLTSSSLFLTNPTLSSPPSPPPSSTPREW